MQTNRLITKLQHKLFLTLAVTAFMFSISGYIAYLDRDQKERDAYSRQQTENREKNEISFSGPYCFPDKHPQFLLLNIFLTVLLISTIYFTKTFLLSFPVTIISIGRFIYWYFDTQKLFNSNETAIVKGLDSLFYKANYFDILTLTAFTILCVWEFLILFRMLDKNILEKDILP